MIFKQKNNYTEFLKTSFGKPKDDFFNFDLIEKYFKKKNNSTAFHTLSNKTSNDLDFNELFKFIDRTHSKVGQQYLFNQLKTFQNKNNINESLITQLAKNESFRLGIQKELEKLKQYNAYYISTLFQEKPIQKPKWFFFIKILFYFSIFSLITTIFYSAFFPVLLLVYIINLIIHYWNKKNIYVYLQSIPQLLILNSVAVKLNKITDSYNLSASKLNQAISEVIKIRRGMFFFRLETNLQNDLMAILWAIIELVKILFILEPILLFKVLDKLDKKKKEIEEVFEFVAWVDIHISIASLRSGLPYFCIPKIEKDNKLLTTTGIYHPLIPDCVSNDIDIKNKSILLTGSNMSGKTTFIRTVGINIITGTTLNTCFAKEITFPKIRVFSAIRISDDLLNNKSYYFEEVLTIKNMIFESKSGIPNLFLLDEIFKGTNTIERIAAGKAVLSYLTKNNNIVLVATHDIELTDLLKNEYALYHFSELVNDKTVDFDYKIKQGKLKTRNAIKILKLNNYPDEIIGEAMELSKHINNF